jgi:hypothetical protein
MQNPSVDCECIDKQEMVALDIGGSKGHVNETIDGTLLQLYNAYRWKPIPQCTGRYTCRDHKIVSTLTPLQLLCKARVRIRDNGISLGEELKCTMSSSGWEFQIPGRSDNVIVVALDESKTTGIITYVKRGDGDEKQYVHTLNSPSGFRRKLEAIGITQTTEGQYCSQRAS